VPANFFVLNFFTNKDIQKKSKKRENRFLNLFATIALRMQKISCRMLFSL